MEAPPAAAEPTPVRAPPVPTARPTVDDVEQVAQQGEASVEQVEADLKRMGTFSAEVRRTLDMHDKTNRDMQQAIGYFRRESRLNMDSRDADKAKLSGFELEVAELQRRIKALEADKKALQADKTTLKEANAKVLKQLSSMFAFGQSVQSGLAFQGLAPTSNSNASSSD
jgi:chromosome segregation ATPase